ncbi:FAD-dependent oxidoreductase [Pseudonocardia xinjiangensis]|uniref:FAD-dependent oxidoreductase n=1 Tax=Pseudonocardia xinjiangensis TaxID=75289 RepID=UPI003D947C1D
MLTDARGITPGGRVSADVCVIGTGPAGAVVAAELAHRGVDVVVVEGGSQRFGPRQADTYRGETVDPHDPLEAVRQKRLGGTSVVWGGRCSPLDDLDLGPREWLDSAGWPVSGPELEPFYRRAQRHLQAGEYEYSAARSGFPLFAPLPSETLDVDSTWRWSPPTSFAGRMRALAGAANVRLLVEATVVRLERDPVSGAITEAVVAPRPGVEITVVARTYVLAAGGLESARILLASDRQSPAGIGNEYDQVGRHYMTHPVGEVGTVVLSELGRNLALGYVPTRDGVYARRKLALTAAAQARHELGNLKAALWFPDPMDPSHGDGLLSTFSLTYYALNRARLGFKSAGTHARYASTSGLGQHIGNVAHDWRRVGRFAVSWAAPRITGGRILPSFMPLDGATCRLRFDAEQSSDPANRVTLSRDRDQLGQRRLQVHYGVSTDDRARIRRSMELIGEEFARLGYGTVDMADAARIDDMPFTDGTHQMGLLRMATSPRQGVVDADCRVHGSANLYVAGSAVFPTAGAVGPTLTIAALACRVADHIAAERSVREPLAAS